LGWRHERTDGWRKIIAFVRPTERRTYRRSASVGRDGITPPCGRRRHNQRVDGIGRSRTRGRGISVIYLLNAAGSQARIGRPSVAPRTGSADDAIFIPHIDTFGICRGQILLTARASPWMPSFSAGFRDREGQAAKLASQESRWSAVRRERASANPFASFHGVPAANGL